MLPELQTEFLETYPGDLINGADPRVGWSTFLSSLAQDNAYEMLTVLVECEIARSKAYGPADPQTRAKYAMSQHQSLSALASINRSTFASSYTSISEQPLEGFLIGRRSTMVAYEEAVLAAKPIDAKGFLYVDAESRTLKYRQGSLRRGPWRQPANCAAYLELTTYDEPKLSFRVIEVKLAMGSVLAQNTIFANWPE